MGSEASFNEWEKYMDACAKRLLQDTGENSEHRPSKSSKKGTRRVLRKRAKVEKRPKAKKVMEGEASVQRSRSRAVKRQKSKTGGNNKEFSESPEGTNPQKKKRQRSIAYDSGDINQTA